MGEYIYKATSLIAKAFDEHGVKYQIIQNDGFEQVQARFSVRCGPVVTLRFISRDDDNDVAVRIFGLVSEIPDEKMVSALKACNTINREKRFYKFCVDMDGQLNVEYDLPLSCSDESVGIIAFELLNHAMHMLDDGYELIIKALFCDDEEDPGKLDKREELLRKFRYLRNRMEQYMLAQEIDRQESDDDEDDGSADDREDEDEPPF